MLKKLLWKFGPLFALVAILVFFAVAEKYWGQGQFLSTRNFRVMMNSAALIAVPAFGMTIIIISGGIDLSAGTALTLCGTVLAVMLKNAPTAAPDTFFGDDALAFTLWMFFA